MISRGIQVIAIAPRDDYADKLTAEGVSYVPLKLKAHSTSPLNDLSSWIQLYRIYRKIRPHLVIHYTIKMNIYGSIACRWLGIKSISVVTGLGRTFQLSSWTQPWINRLYRYATSGNLEVWTLNHEDKDRLIEEGIAHEEDLFVLPSEGVNTHKFVGSIPSPHKKVFRFLYAGRLLRDKGIIEFVSAAKTLKKTCDNVLCEVVGFVNPEDKMSVRLSEIEQWQKLGYINYLGSHEDIRPFINRSDCVVYPSFYQEGVSRILLEAASMSRPIITTDQVGCRDVVIHDKTGIIIPPRATMKLVEAMKNMAESSYEDRLIMGYNARQYIGEKFSEEDIIEIYFDRLLSKLVQSCQEDSKKNLTV